VLNEKKILSSDNFALNSERKNRNSIRQLNEEKVIAKLI
jgi:hypothetical protein